MRSLQVQFAIDDLAHGERIVSDLLHDRLVACAQTVGPVTSRYWWQGTLTETREWLFLCKTTSARVDDVIERIRGQHPYDVPEIVACELAPALAAYVDWIAAETQ
jgi:periplasmic divalent cation tolerance protein